MSPAGPDHATAELERRYARWTALFYPADYRRRRGSELVDTYLSLASPGRRRPSVADVADLAAGGLRQRLRIAEDLAPAFQLAGLLALMTATALAAGWATSQVPARLGVVMWAPWLLAAVVHVAAPGRWYRRAAGLGVLATAGVVPIAMLTGLPRPPLSVLLPQFVLGVVALGAATRHPWWVRLMPMGAAAVSVPVIAGSAPDPEFFIGSYWYAAAVLPAAATALLIGATLLAFGLAARRDPRGLWALLILVTPIGMLAVVPLGAMLDDTGPGRPIIPTWSSMVIASVLVAAAGPALVSLGLAARRRELT
ncbi:hypothetical protein AB0J80_24250 [Actinoplanes sp. NPDC049548]|uniref:hypothetical protein n=1 Tax=Actinoplanes sp. NPDC049548 TaxID=3155152 RepID=UPI00343DB2E7